MQAQTLTRVPAFRVFLFDAVIAVNRWFWPPRRERPFFLIGGWGFWLLAAAVLWAWYLAKVTVYLAVLMTLVIAQGVTMLAGIPRMIWHRVR